MPYTNVWSTASPLGTAAANTIDDIFRALKLDIEERFEDMFDMPNFATDPLRPYNVKLSTAPAASGNKIVVGASGGLLVRNAADSATNLAITDAGIITARGGLTTSAAAGDIVVPNNVGLRSNNAAGNDTIGLVRLDGSNRLTLNLNSQRLVLSNPTYDVSAGALFGYLKIMLDGIDYKIPVYANA